MGKVRKNKDKGTAFFHKYFLWLWALVATHAFIQNMFEVSTSFKRDGFGRANFYFGTATNYHHTLELKRLGITVHAIPDKRIQKECSYGGQPSKSDDGTAMEYGSVAGCAVTKKDGKVDIWIKQEDVRPVLLHELCHADGTHTPRQCSDMFP